MNKLPFFMTTGQYIISMIPKLVNQRVCLPKTHKHGSNANESGQIYVVTVNKNSNIKK